MKVLRRVWQSFQTFTHRWEKAHIGAYVEVRVLLFAGIVVPRICSRDIRSLMVRVNTGFGLSSLWERVEVVTGSQNVINRILVRMLVNLAAGGRIEPVKEGIGTMR